MSNDLDELLRIYTLNPRNYIVRTPNTIDAANNLMDLLYMTDNSEELQDLLAYYCPISPEYIINSDYPTEERINLLKYTHLHGTGVESITEYYDMHYNYESLSEDFDLTAHCMLLEQLIFKLTKETLNFNKTWFLTNMLKLTPILADVQKEVNKLDKIKLAGIMPLHYIIENTKAFYKNSNYLPRFDKLAHSLDKITDHIYGSNKENILALAHGLYSGQNPEYWKSCVHNPNAKPVKDCELPIF